MPVASVVRLPVSFDVSVEAFDRLDNGAGTGSTAGRLLVVVEGQPQVVRFE